MLIILRSLSLFVAFGLFGVVALILVDYVLILPWFIRILVLMLAAILLLTGVFRLLVPAFRFRSSSTQIAFRLEESVPELRGKIASAAEFHSSDLVSGNELAKNLVDEVDQHLSTYPMSSIIRVRPVLLSSGFMLSSIIVVLAFLLLGTNLSLTGISRLLLPLGGARWPATTLLVPQVTDGDVHPRGVPLSLSARLEMGDSTTRVSARYSVYRDGEVASRQRVLLAPQGDGIFERMVEVDGDRIDVVFETFDFTSDPSSIEIVEPPSIVSTRLEVDPPSYASGQLDPITLDLGTGVDPRSSPDSPFIEGSTARFRFELSKDIPVPSEIDDLWMETTFGELGSDARFVQETPTSWVLERTLESPVSALFTLVDEHGIINTDEISFGIQVAVDRTPSVVVVEPTMDETVLPDAMIPIRAEGRDDISIESATVDINRRSTAGSVPVGEDERGSGSIEFPSGTPSIDMQHILHLGDLGARSGDIFEISATVEDGFVRDGVKHPASVSNIRRISVIDPGEFSELIQQQMASIRNNTIQTESMQEEVQRRSTTNPDSSSIDQSRISQRILNTDEALEQIEDRMSRNNLDDPVLEELVRQSRDILNVAGRSSSRASERLEAAAESSDLDSSADESRMQEDIDGAIESQQDVRDELTDLVALLDRNEDAWLVTRQVENLIEEINRLRDETGGMAGDTMGRTRSELTPEQRDELDRLAERQDEMSRESREISDSLRERSELMRDTDQQTSESMESAARRSERSELARTLEEASDQIRDNQLTNAQDSQEESIETLEKMLEDLKEDRSARAEQLVRELANLVQSIEALVATNEDELIELSRLPEPGTSEFMDSVSERVDTQLSLAGNTASVGFEATSSGPSGQRIARRIGSAERHQGDSILTLRSEVIDIDASEFQMDESLSDLNEALDLARSAEEAARAEESRQKRDALRKSYLALAEREAGLLVETREIAPDPGESTSRRTRVKARRLSLEQESIRAEVGGILEENPEIGSTILVSRVHEMIDEWSADVRDRLHDGETGALVRSREQSIIDSLLDLADILAESDPDESPFGRNEQGAPGQAGQSQQQQQQQEPTLFPPVTELKLLRNLQAQIYRQTRALQDDRVSSDANPGRLDSNLSELAEMQSELFELGTRLMESIKQDEPMRPEPNQQEPSPGNDRGAS